MDKKDLVISGDMMLFQVSFDEKELKSDSYLGGVAFMGHKFYNGDAKIFVVQPSYNVISGKDFHDIYYGFRDGVENPVVSMHFYDKSDLGIEGVNCLKNLDKYTIHSLTDGECVGSYTDTNGITMSWRKVGHIEDFESFSSKIQDYEWITWDPSFMYT